MMRDLMPLRHELKTPWASDEQSPDSMNSIDTMCMRSSHATELSRLRLIEACQPNSATINSCG